MAVVDFSNARIEPVGTKSIFGNNSNSHLNLRDSFRNASGTVINSGTITQVVSAQNQLLYAYSGTFAASGTEFYIGQSISSGSIVHAWRISNISFQSGDTYSFQINASLLLGNT